MILMAGQKVPADEALSGPVRTKLALADAAQMDFWRDFATALHADVVARNEREFCKSHDCSVPRATPKPRGS